MVYIVLVMNGNENRIMVKDDNIRYEIMFVQMNEQLFVQMNEQLFVQMNEQFDFKPNTLKFRIFTEKSWQIMMKMAD